MWESKGYYRYVESFLDEVTWAMNLAGVLLAGVR